LTLSLSLSLSLSIQLENYTGLVKISSMNAMDLIKMPGLGMLKHDMVDGHQIRMISHGQLERLGKNPYIGGCFLLNDVLALLGANTELSPDPEIDITVVKVLIEKIICMVQVVNTSNLYRILLKDSNVSKILVKVEEDVHQDKPWILNGVQAGFYRKASVLLHEPALNNMNCYFKEACLEGLYIRQLDECWGMPDGETIKNRFILEDVARHLLCKGIQFYASKWIETINLSDTPSLLRIDNDNNSVCLYFYLSIYR